MRIIVVVGAASTDWAESTGFGLGTLHEARSRRARLEFVEGGGCGKHLAKKWDSGSSCRLPGSSGDRRIRSTRVS